MGNSPGKRGFRLLKFFAFSSLGVLLAFTFPFSVIISKNAKGLLFRSYENYALLLGQNLDHQILQNFSLPVISKYGQIRLRDEEQYNLMDKVVRNTVHSFKIDMVNIYDINKGVIAYSTEPRLVGRPVMLGEGYKSATLGQNSSRLIKKGGDLWGVGVIIPKDQVKLRTFLPFKGI
ncbi:MAG: two-component sensor histidine kinase, partial [Desulfatiglandales bacterium]